MKNKIKLIKSMIVFSLIIISFIMTLSVIFLAEDHKTLKIAYARKSYLTDSLFHVIEGEPNVQVRSLKIEKEFNASVCNNGLDTTINIKLGNVHSSK